MALDAVLLSREQTETRVNHAAAYMITTSTLAALNDEDPAQAAIMTRP